MASLTRSEITKRYDEKNSKNVSLKFNLKYDSDIIEKLSKVDSVNGYIKQLIRQDLQKEQQETRYRIRPEYMDLWGSDASDETIIDYQTIVNLSEQWEKPINELLNQLTEID